MYFAPIGVPLAGSDSPFGPAEAVGRRQTWPVERKIMVLSSLLSYENVGSKQIIYSKIV